MYFSLENVLQNVNFIFTIRIPILEPLDPLYTWGTFARSYLMVLIKFPVDDFQMLPHRNTGKTNLFRGTWQKINKQSERFEVFHNLIFKRQKEVDQGKMNCLYLEMAAGRRRRLIFHRFSSFYFFSSFFRQLKSRLWDTCSTKNALLRNAPVFHRFFVSQPFPTIH